MKGNEVTRGRFYINEKRELVREITDEVDESQVRWQAYSLTSGAPLSGGACSRHQIIRWATREASAEEVAKLQIISEEQRSYISRRKVSPQNKRRQEHECNVIFILNGKRYTGDWEPLEGEQYFIIERGREVDVALTLEEMQRRTQRGWRVVFDCSNDDWGAVTEKAISYAKANRKLCRVGPPMSEDDWNAVWGNAKRALLGEDLWAALVALGRIDMPLALILYQESIAIRCGTSSSKSEGSPVKDTAKYPGWAWFSRMEAARNNVLTSEEKEDLDTWSEKNVIEGGEIGLSDWPGWEKHIGLRPRMVERDYKGPPPDAFFNRL